MNVTRICDLAQVLVTCRHHDSVAILSDNARAVCSCEIVTTRAGVQERHERGGCLVHNGSGGAAVVIRYCIACGALRGVLGTWMPTMRVLDLAKALEQR